MRTGQTVEEKKRLQVLQEFIFYQPLIMLLMLYFCRLGQEVTQIPDRVPRLDLSHPFGEQTSQG